jgi:hypothetical protein
MDEEKRMPATEDASGLHGRYRDVIRDAAGAVRWESGWRKNVIVGDCRRLLAGLLRGTPTGATAIQGLQVGTGLSAWDQPPGIPPSDASQTALVDPAPFLVPRASLVMNYLVGAVVSGTPTNRLQIVANLGPNVPPWPDANHAAPTLREFGLVATLDGATVLINYVRHPAIVKDPASTLERTVWLVF